VKLMRYSRRNEPAALARLGILVGDDRVADLRAGHALYLLEEKGNPKGEELSGIFMPPYITQFLYLGDPDGKPWRKPMRGWRYCPRRCRRARAARREAVLAARGLPAVCAAAPWQADRHRPQLSRLLARGRQAIEKHPDRVSQGHLVHHRAGSRHSQARRHGGPRLRDRARRRDCRKCKHVTPERALESVAGYTILNDVSARDIAAREREAGQVLLGKCFDTFAPIGPWLVTRDELPEPLRLNIRTRVNGVLRQEGDTSSMVHPIAQLVAYLSR